DSPGVANNLFKIAPGINLQSGNLSGHAMLGLAAGKSGNLSLLPFIESTIKIPNADYRISGGWLSAIVQNTYQQLTMENPYIFNNYQLQQTRSDELFINITGNYGLLQFSGRVSWCNYKSLPTYLD